MGFLKRLSVGKVQKKARIVLLGSSGAGKTTLVRFLETGKPVEQEVKTTLGLDIRKKEIKVGPWLFRAIDVGGQELYQQTFWALGTKQADAVIYVIDGTIRPGAGGTRWELSYFQFEYMVGLLREGMPLLVLINKQDLKDLNPLTTKEAIELYGINEVFDRSFVVLPSSAKYGDGVETSMIWLAEKLEDEKFG